MNAFLPELEIPKQTTGAPAATNLPRYSTFKLVIFDNFDIDFHYILSFS